MNKLAIALCLAVVSCGGTPPDVVQSTSGALYPPFTTYDRSLGGYKCANSSLSWGMSTKATFRQLAKDEGWPAEYTYGVQFDLDLDSSPALGNISFWSSVFPLKESRDGGTLHLTNGYYGGVVYTSTNPYIHGYPVPDSEPMEIPQDGIIIYDAAPPWHSTVTIMMAPHTTPPLDQNYGRCNATQHFRTSF